MLYKGDRALLYLLIEFFGFLVDVLFRCVRFRFFNTMQSDWLGRMSLERPVLC